MPRSASQVRKTPSPAHAMPCDRCRLTDCYSIHGHAAPTGSCPLQFCEVCKDLAELDQQISAVQDQLIKLVRKRWTMKSRFNNHHDQLTRRLPMEIISDIFLFVAASMQNAYRVVSTNEILPPIFLGAICKRWRDITLGLPQLWGTLYIKPWSPQFSFNNIDEWLRRSSTVPLSVAYSGHPPWDPWRESVLYRDPRVVNLLRSQAARWKHFTFHGPWKAVHDLFHNANDIMSLNTLDISITDGYAIEMESIHLHEPICPNQLTTNAVAIIKIPIQWNNLTHLDAWHMHLDELLHIIRYGTKLTSCIVTNLLGHGTDYPLPTTPIVHQTMSLLKLHYIAESHSILIPYITLPHLKTFTYYFNALEQDALVDFLDRSRAPLHTFVFDIDLKSAMTSWYERLPEITHLDLGFYRIHDLSTVEEDFFSALKGTTGTLILPHLRELRIFADSMLKSSWSILYDISMATGREDANPGIVAGAASDSEVTEKLCDQQLVGERPTRPLKSVYIRFKHGLQWRTIAEEDVLSNLLAIRASGVRLEITDRDGSDLIEYAAKIITNRELPFSGNESWYELTGNVWESE